MTTNNATTLVNCGALASRSSFPAYIQTLQNVTANNLTLLEVCKADVCNALWGTGNSDISGIGVLFGYIFESVIGFCFAFGLEVLRSKRTNLQSPRSRFEIRLEELLLIGCNVFFDCAASFAGAILIASMVMLIEKDFGISAANFGGLTVQITLTAACLSMLPLLYPLIMLPHFVVEAENEEQEQKPEISKARHQYRWYILCVFWIPLLYIFISKMIEDFAPSQIGQGAGGGGTTIVTTNEWDTIVKLCFTDVQMPENEKSNFREVINIAGYILMSVLALYRLFLLIFNRWALNLATRIEWCFTKVTGKKKPRSLIPRVMLVILPTLTISQIWAIFSLRDTQELLAVAIGGSYVDNKWTFGQVVAMVIFIPVFIEVIYCWMH